MIPWSADVAGTSTISSSGGQRSGALRRDATLTNILFERGAGVAGRFTKYLQQNGQETFLGPSPQSVGETTTKRPAPASASQGHAGTNAISIHYHAQVSPTKIIEQRSSLSRLLKDVHKRQRVPATSAEEPQRDERHHKGCRWDQRAPTPRTTVLPSKDRYL